MQGPGDVGVCFVKNLPYDLSDEALEEHFSSSGPVTRAFVVKDRKTKQSRGFGYVHFAIQDDADRAVEELHRSGLGDRKISVELSVNKGAGAAPSEPRSSTRDTSAAPSSAVTARPAAAAAPPAASAAPGAPPSKRGRDGEGRDVKSAKKPAAVRHRLIVRNLAFGCDESRLRAAFDSAVTVVDAHIPKRPNGGHPGFGFIEVATDAECDAAIAAVNEKKICGRMVAVDRALHRKAYEQLAAKQPKAPVEEESEEEESEGEESEGEESEGGESGGEGSERGESGGEEREGESGEESGEEEIDAEMDAEMDADEVADESAEDDEEEEEEEDKDDSTLSSTLFIQSLPIQATEAELSRRFTQYGKVHVRHL